MSTGMDWIEVERDLVCSNRAPATRLALRPPISPLQVTWPYADQMSYLTRLSARPEVLMALPRPA